MKSGGRKFCDRRFLLVDYLNLPKTKSIRLVGKLFLLFLSRKFLVFVKSFGVLFFRFYEEFLGKFGLRFL